MACKPVISGVANEEFGTPAEFLPDNPYDTLSEGCDFARNHMPDNIDYATIHLWPDTWLSGGQCSEEAALRFARRWINAHVDCCTRLGKPLVLTEFGKKPAGPPRATFYQKVSLQCSQVSVRQKQAEVLCSITSCSLQWRLKDAISAATIPSQPFQVLRWPPSDPDKPKGRRWKGLQRLDALPCLAPQVYDTAFGNALCGRPLGGILQWMVASGTYPDYDEFTCRIPGTEDPCGCPGADKAAVHTMLRFAQRFAALNRDRIIPVASL